MDPLNWLWDDEVWPALTYSAKKALGGTRSSVVATAYLGKNAAKILPLKSGDRLLVDASDASVRAGATSVAAIDAYVAKGVDVRSRSGLHSKAYVLGGTAFVGSANLSASGLIESMLKVTEPAVVRDIRQRLLAEHEATIDLTNERLDWLRGLPVHQRFRARRTDNDRLDQGLGRVTRIRVLSVGFSNFSAQEAKALAGTQRAARRRAGPARLWELDPLGHEAAFSSHLRKDGTDAVLERVGNTAYAPALVVESYKAGRAGALTYLARPTDAPELDWGDLRALYVEETGQMLRSNSLVTQSLGVRSLLAAFGLLG